MATTPDQKLADPRAREEIKRAFYAAYLEHGLNVLVTISEVAEELHLDQAQARRCFDYLTAKGLIRPFTRGGGYVPTVDLVDDIEGSATA